MIGAKKAVKRENEMIAQKLPRKPNYKIRYIRQNWGLYLCLLPGIVFYLVFCYAPMAGIIVAFKDYNIFKGILESPWVGLKYFSQLLELPNFWNVIRNTLMLNVLSLLFGFPAPIILALMLNELRSTVFKRVSQSLLYIPHFMSWIILASILTNLLSPQYGAINGIIKFFGGKPIFFLADPFWWTVAYVVAGVWAGVGWGTIIYMAALTAIDPALYEAATIDGASRMQRIGFITIPSIMPTVVIMLILQVGKLVSIGFEQPMAMYNPLVSDVAEVISTFTYSMGIQRGQYSLTTALGLLQSVINLIMIVTANKITKKLGSDGLY